MAAGQGTPAMEHVSSGSWPGDTSALGVEGSMACNVLLREEIDQEVGGEGGNEGGHQGPWGFAEVAPPSIGSPKQGDYVHVQDRTS